jgi:hypothetical protein
MNTNQTIRTAVFVHGRAEGKRDAAVVYMSQQ